MKSKLIYLIAAISILLLSISFNYNKEKIEISKKDYGNQFNNYAFESNDSYGSTYNNNSSESKEPDMSTYVDEEINGYRLIIEDDAGLLSSTEEQELYEEMKKVTIYGNAAFKTINYNPNYSTESYAKEYYHNKFSYDESGVLFLIDMDKREIYIFSDGTIHRTITDSKALIITDNTYRYATREEYLKCATEAFREINQLLGGGKIIEPMKIITTAILSAVIAALLGLLMSIKKASIKEATPDDLVKHLNKKIEVIGDITAEKTGQRKVYNPPSDSSSSGGSSGGHSSGGGGGHSSGGGGGHRF